MVLTGGSAAFWVKRDARSSQIGAFCGGTSLGLQPYFGTLASVERLAMSVAFISDLGSLITFKVAGVVFGSCRSV